MSKQTVELARMNRLKDDTVEEPEEDQEGGVNEDFNTEGDPLARTPYQGPLVTPEALRMEEEEIRELEKKKRGLENWINGMEIDLGGLQR